MDALDAWIVTIKRRFERPRSKPLTLQISRFYAEVAIAEAITKCGGRQRLRLIGSSGNCIAVMNFNELPTANFTSCRSCQPVFTTGREAVGVNNNPPRP